METFLFIFPLLSCFLFQFFSQKIKTGSVVGELCLEGPAVSKGYFNDLKKTIGEIIPDPTFQKSISVHIAEIDSSFNPKDHSDHISSANLILNVMDNKTPYHLHNYVEYHTNNLPINIFPEEYQINVGTWGATTSGISDFGHNSTWDEVHNSWLGRQYFTKHLIRD